MNRNYLRALSGLLRQAAAAAENTALPLNARFAFLSNAALFQCLDGNIGAQYSTLQTPNMPYASQHMRHVSTSPHLHTAATDLEPIADLPYIRGVPDSAIYSLIEQAEFMESVDYLKDELGFSERDATHMLAKLAWSGFTSDGRYYVRKAAILPSLKLDIKPTVQYLETIPGIRLQRSIKASPLLLIQGVTGRMQMENNRKWFEKTFNLEGIDLGRIVNTNGYALTRPIEALQASIDVLTGIGLTLEEIKRMLRLQGRILAVNPSHIETRIDELKDIGMSEEQIRAVLKEHPNLLLISKSKIDDLISWLGSLGLSPMSTLRVIREHPVMCSYSIPAKLDPLVKYLEQDLGLPRKAIKRILEYAPDTFGRQLSTIKENVDQMKAAGFEHNDLVRFLTAWQGALRCDFSRPNYAAKLRYLTEELGLDLGPTLATNPMYLTYGIDRITSRGSFLKNVANRPVKSVSSWLSANESNFAELYGKVPLAQWMEYKVEYMGSAEARKWAALAAVGGM